MSVHPLGPAGVLERIRSIQAKIDTLFPRGSQDRPPFALQGQGFESHLAQFMGGSRGFSGLEGAISSFTGGVSPLSPFTEGIRCVCPEVTPSGSSPFQPLIHQAARHAGIDPYLYEAIIKVESDFNPRTVSHKGAMGLSQLMPETVKTLRITDPFDPAQNLYGGAQHFAHMLRRFNNTELALAAYNAGPGAVRKYGGIPPYRETQNYVRKVLSHYQKLTEQRNPDPSKTG